jgi:hypothetical protein
MMCSELEDLPARIHLGNAIIDLSKSFHDRWVLYLGCHQRVRRRLRTKRIVRCPDFAVVSPDNTMYFIVPRDHGALDESRQRFRASASRHGFTCTTPHERDEAEWFLRKWGAIS